jgi:hypothetical protein
MISEVGLIGGARCRCLVKCRWHTTTYSSYYGAYLIDITQLVPLATRGGVGQVMMKDGCETAWMGGAHSIFSDEAPEDARWAWLKPYLT